MKFLVLTHATKRILVRYRADSIHQYWSYSDNDGAYLRLADGTIEQVSETTKQIDELFAKIGAQP